MRNNLIKPLCIAGGLAVLLTMVTLNPSAAQSSSSAGGGRLEGTWDVQVSIIDCQSGNVIRTFPSLTQFMARGTLIDSTSGIPQALKTPGEGVWSRTGGNIYSFRFKSFSFDAQGVFTGWTIIQQDATLDPTGNSYTSSGTSEIYNASGVLIATGCSTTVAARFDF